MATPRRRSSRIRGISPQVCARRGVLVRQTAEFNKKTEFTTAALAALVERDETEIQGPPTTAAIASPSTTTALFDTSCTPNLASVKTPTTGGRLRASPEEMHPSRYQSTAKKLASSKRLSIANADRYQMNNGVLRSSPVRPSPAQPSFASPNFQFRYRQSTDMSTETQRMMDDIRQQAARIKEGLATEREEQFRKDEEAEQLFGRKLATPKGKLGRFSDVHMDQFKKMNSIANHASTFRADAAKVESENVTLPAVATLPATKSLKRTNSKAELDKLDNSGPLFTTAKVLAQSDIGEGESPAKRFKQRHEAAIEARRQDAAAVNLQTKSNIPRLPSSKNLTTPSKTPLARSASVKSFKTNTSMLPQLAKSPSMRTSSTPTTNTRFFPHTEGSKKHTSSFAQKLNKVKSILRPPQIRFSDDPAKIVAGTHLSTPRKDTATNSALSPLVEGTPGTPAWRKEKHVNFSTSTKNPDEQVVGTPTTPSPIKMPGTYPIVYPALTTTSDTAPPTPTHTGLSSNTVRASVAGPGDFTFRTDKTINFGPGPSPGKTPTIRKVRASDSAFALVGLNGINAASKDGFEQLPHNAHGLSNKKRKRVTGDEIPVVPQIDAEEDKENTEADAEDLEQRGSPAKRARITMDVAPKPVLGGGAVNKAKTLNGTNSRIPKRKGGSVLSLSRLSALAQPKVRK